MDIYFKDYLASRIICQNKELDDYFKTYYQTNEDLSTIYKIINFKDKSVLTVLGSGDQFYTSYFLGASNVDTFDMNRLALYYFYLRKWSIKYENKLLPDIDSRKWLLNMLKKVVPNSFEEKKALEFYFKHLEEYTNFNNFFYDYLMQPEGKTIYKDAKELFAYADKDLNFNLIDLFKENNIIKTYDIILISNILDWAKNDLAKQNIAAENLAKMTKKDSKIICSNIVYKNEKEKKQEIDVFSEYFKNIPCNTSKNTVYVRK